MAGANEDSLDLFDFGDAEGPGYLAKLQHPLGVHYCAANDTLYVTDTYNHKIKVIKPHNTTMNTIMTTTLQEQGSSASNASSASHIPMGLQDGDPLLTWIGNAQEARVKDGPPEVSRLNEPNACFSKTDLGPDG